MIPIVLCLLGLLAMEDATGLGLILIVMALATCGLHPPRPEK